MTAWLGWLLKITDRPKMLRIRLSVLMSLVSACHKRNVASSLCYSTMLIHCGFKEYHIVFVVRPLHLSILDGRRRSLTFLWQPWSCRLRLCHLSLSHDPELNTSQVQKISHLFGICPFSGDRPVGAILSTVSVLILITYGYCEYWR